MVIKPIETREEVKGKAYVHYQAWQETYTGLIDQSYLDKRTLAQSERMAESAFAKGYAGFIAKENDRVTGFADYGACRDEDLKNTGELYAIYVLREFHGQGIGSMLMEHAMNAMKEYDRVNVWVLEENQKAIRFYQNCGFREDGTKKLLNLGSPVTEIRMIREKER